MAHFEKVDLFKVSVPGKKIYFASDFHLGAPSSDLSRNRELRIIEWLKHIQKDASSIFLVGDIFDFWFEYKHAVPKGFVRFQGKLAELADQGIPVYLFAGNHDLWVGDYLSKEIGLRIFNHPIQFESNNKKFLVGHGDGLGNGNHFYKLLKRVFIARLPTWLFRWLHPDIGIPLAQFSSHSSKERSKKKDEHFRGEEEVLFNYCKAIEKDEHHDMYVFGHRHLPIEMSISEKSTYFNLGDWMKSGTYLEFDGEKATLLSFTSHA